MPLTGGSVVIESGPSPTTSAASPPLHKSVESRASTKVRHALTGDILTAGSQTVTAGGTDARASTDDVHIQIRGSLAPPLLTLAAKRLQSTANLDGSCGSLTAAGETMIANGTLTLPGLPSVEIDSHPEPNTVLIDTPGIRVVANERIVTGSGTNKQSLTVNAIHVYLTNVNLLGIGTMTGDLIVAQSRAEACCGQA